MHATADARPAIHAGPYRPVAVLRDALVAGLLGAAAIMVFFLVLDALAGHPLRTPTVLGSVLLGKDLSAIESLPVSLPVVLLYTAVHTLAFLAVGYVAAWLFAVAQHHPPWIFGLLLFFILFFCGFLAVPIVTEPGVFRVVTIPKILAGNMLAAAAMGRYLWRRRPLDLRQLL
ncbi:MAG TPA: hypothetical protein VFY93_20010 [Planctomycetota bacterium]|nr:hypothetical protein [Planctomycetota bacterium]